MGQNVTASRGIMLKIKYLPPSTLGVVLRVIRIHVQFLAASYAFVRHFCVVCTKACVYACATRAHIPPRRALALMGPGYGSVAVAAAQNPYSNILV